MIPRPASFDRARLRGAVLILSLGVLVVLAMMATIFTTLASVERNVSRNYVDDVRARMLAESGLNEGMARLRGLVQQGREDVNGNGSLDPGEDLNSNGVLDACVSWPEVTTWRYGGEDWNGSGLLDDPREKSADRNGLLDSLTCPAEDALSPSLAETDASGRPRLVNLREGTATRPAGVSGALAVGSYGRNSDIYSLKIVDASSQIYLNDANPNLRRILNNLGFHVLGWSATGGAGLGDRVLNARRSLPARRFFSKQELYQRGVVSESDFARIRDYLTVHTWVDDKVVNPVPLSEWEHQNGPYLVKEGPGNDQYLRPVATVGWQSGQKIYRYGPGWSLNFNDITGSMKAPIPRRPYHRFAQSSVTAAAHPYSRVYGVDELNPQWIEVASRAPININTAPREILLALIEGLDGFYLLERNRLLMGSSGYAPWAFTQYLFGETGGGVTARVFDPASGSPVVVNPLNNGSELGILYTTGPILGPAGTSYGGQRGTLAGILADKIIAYRSGRDLFPAGNGLPDLREGAFTSWAQFHEFCDRLVLQDPDVQAAILEGTPYPWNPGWPEWYAHAQARMDVLKANFDPNLHLNELNPDSPLWTWVDKTDLVTASTEFCFQPMGVFEITSVGRVVQPGPVGADLFAPGVVGEVVAEKAIVGDVRLYGAVRETAQRDFYGGDPANDTSVTPRTGPAGERTNNNLSLQTGPEPENGDAPYDNEYEGYLALSPLGGAGKAVQKRQVWTNLPLGPGSSTRLGARSTETVGGTSEFGEWFHAHFDYDFNGHYQTTQDTTFLWSTYSWFGERRVHYGRRFDRETSNGIQWYNYPDPSETANANDPADPDNIRGPYCLADRYDGIIAPKYDRLAGSPACRKEYRCGRSFHVSRPPAGSTAAPVPVPSGSSASTPFHFYAPSDLRIDGGYSERHSAICWASRNDPHQIHTPINAYQGAVSYWIKPNFFPEISGKIRTFFSISRPHHGPPNAPAGWHWLNPTPFAHHLTTRHNSSGLPSYPGGDLSYEGINLRPRRAFLFGWGFDADSGYLPGIAGICRPMVGGAITDTLNEIQLPNFAPADSLLRSRYLTPPEQRAVDAHRWCHVLLVWNMEGPDPTNWKIYVNGRNRSPSPSGVFQDRNPTPRAFPADFRRTTIGQSTLGGPYGPPNGGPGDGSSAAQGYMSYEWFTPAPASGVGTHFVNDLPISPIRLGEPTSLLAEPRWGQTYTRNFPADSTFDEFYVFGEAAVGEAQGMNLWRQGRYYRRNDGVYSSRRLDVSWPGLVRRLPPRVGATTGTAGTPPTPREQEILGVAWTLHARDYRSSIAPDPLLPGLGQFRVYDYFPSAATPVGRVAGVILEVGVPDPGTGGYRWYGASGSGSTLRDFRWSAPFRDAAGTLPVTLSNPAVLKYRARFLVNGANPGASVLLDSPILDDVTVFYSIGKIDVLDWIEM